MSKTIHPLHYIWRNCCKHAGRNIVKEWMDFDAFCAGVGDRPSHGYRLTRPKRGHKLGPDNFEWKKIVVTTGGDFSVNQPQLYETWRGFTRAKSGIVPEWRVYDVFAAAVGERPSPRHALMRLNVHEPLGPSNWEWRERLEWTDKKKNHAAYMREYWKRNPEKAKAMHLKRAFGIALEEYNEIGESQRWVCAICAQPEQTVIRGKVLMLSVDHCHDSKSVRGLLCRQCNQGIGHFLDDPQRLRAAADYIERHR